MVDKVLSSVKKETDRQYFFTRLRNPLWIEPLLERGYFSNPPPVSKLSDGSVLYPHWPEMVYLINVAPEAPDQTIDIVLHLPKTENPRIYNNILEIALKIKGKKSARLLPKLIEYTNLKNHFFAHRFSDIIKHWTNHGNINEALEIINRLIHFQEDPKFQKKFKLRKKNPNTIETTLEPTPRFHEWEYREILKKGVQPLAEKAPYQVARILIDAVAGMVNLGMFPDDLEKRTDQDFSDIWCHRLDKPDRHYSDVKEMLVHTLTHACEQVFINAPESIEALDQALRNQRWRLFKRLRQYLYASHPNEKTLPWIRELILSHEDYSKWVYRYEFQLMIRKASEHFGHRLLSEDERSTIFDAILSGPPKEDFRERKGESYTDEAFLEYQHDFHRRQLRPFTAVLSGKYQHYFEELVKEIQTESITDDNYAINGRVSGGTVRYKSPKTVEELELYTDEELLNYLNDWDEAHQDNDNWLVEINISALAGVFQVFFKDKIIQDNKRRNFWIENRCNIERPIYVRSMVKAMEVLIKEKKFDNLETWFEFCSWILSHPDSDYIEDQPQPQDESRDHPDWGSSRDAVVDFIDMCISKDVGVPISLRENIANLLQLVCNQPDGRLDNDQPVLLNRDDPITEAINNTRSRALESLIIFGYWIRRQLPEDPVPEVTDILSKRISKETDIPLTRPEFALLGRHFGNLCFLNTDWAAEYRKFIFPQEDGALWSDVFGSFIRFNGPHKIVFDMLQEDYEYALEHLNLLRDTISDQSILIDRLGQHLFIYYLWDVYSLTGKSSLLEQFYYKTSDNLKYWALLLNFVGDSLSHSGGSLNKELIDRIVTFFNWRFELSEFVELQEFVTWLEAECLDSEWGLEKFSKILDLGCMTDIHLYQSVKALNKLLTDNLALVVECLTKITNTLDQETQIHISSNDVKPILMAGLHADDPKILENAEHARENLLRLGRFDFLDVE